MGELVSDNVSGVLDEQSAQDRTIMIHLENPFIDEQAERVVGKRYYSQRLKFSEVDTMLTSIFTEPHEAIEEVLMKSAACTAQMKSLLW